MFRFREPEMTPELEQALANERAWREKYQIVDHRHPPGTPEEVQAQAEKEFFQLDKAAHAASGLSYAEYCAWLVATGRSR